MGEVEKFLKYFLKNAIKHFKFEVFKDLKDDKDAVVILKFVEFFMYSCNEVIEHPTKHLPIFKKDSDVILQMDPYSKYFSINVKKREYFVTVMCLKLYQKIYNQSIKTYK